MTGGVTALTAEQMALVNGYSNMYIGWGMEGNKRAAFCSSLLKQSVSMNLFVLYSLSLSAWAKTYLSI